MIVFIKQEKIIKHIDKIFGIIKIQNDNDKIILNIPINQESTNRKIKKISKKLVKYLYNNNVKNVILEETLMINETLKNVLLENNINVIDGSKISKFILYNIIKQIYKYKNKKQEAGEITILANENDEIITETVIKLAKHTKRVNIITHNIKKFKKIVDYLYEELGILIKLSNNMATNLTSSDIIVNIDFSEENLNSLKISNDAIIVNILNENEASQRFSGINIKNYEIDLPKHYLVDGFNEKMIYEAYLCAKNTKNIFKQIEQDNIKIRKLIGINGEINKKEFI